MVVLCLLLHDACLQLFEVVHHVGVNYLNVLVVLCGQVVLEEANLLAQHLDLLFVFAQRLLAFADPLFDAFDLAAHALRWVYRNLGSVLSERVVAWRRSLGIEGARSVTSAVHGTRVVRLQHFQNY